MWTTIVDFLLNTLKSMGDFANFLTTELFRLGDMSITPLSMFGVGTLVVIIGLWVVKLLNPLS